MIALLTYPTLIESPAFQKLADNGSLSHRIWELHRIIANLVSNTTDMKTAGRCLLRAKERAAERSNQGSVVTITSLNLEEAI